MLSGYCQGRSHPHIFQGLIDLCFQLSQVQLENLDLPETLGAGTERGLGLEAKGRGCEVEEMQTLTKRAHPSLGGFLFNLLPYSPFLNYS